MWKVILLMVFLMGGCAHYRTSDEIKTFVQGWTDQFLIQDKNYAQAYEKYLASVQNIYQQADAADKFETYMDSLINNSQIMSDQASALPQLYQDKTGRSVASNQEDYKQFITQQMTSLYDKLFTARELKIKQEAGDKLFGRLKQNHDRFTRQENDGKYSFPF